MVAQVTLSQIFVWSAILSARVKWYFYEEVGWAVIFAANTVASVYLLYSDDYATAGSTLLWLNLLFGLVYLPWQSLHLRMLHADAETQGQSALSNTKITWTALSDGLARSISEKNQSSNPEDWGGWIGATWMVGYWATLIPAWLRYIVSTLVGT